MCGITGIYHLHDNAGTDTQARVEAMSQALAHRGPDASGIFRKGRVSLGHRRLAIIDLDKRSNQPFTDVTGRYTLVFNGQIYNFRDVRAMLTDYPFHTTSDTEVIVAAFSKWKEACVEKFNGMFAFAIYDAEEHALFMARDRIGVKPFYYALKESVFAFASELRSLLASGLVRKQIRQKGVLDFLMFQSALCPGTMLEDVRHIKPGHYAWLRNGELTQKKYWAFGESSEDQPSEYTNAVRQVRQLLLESVERRMVSDVPLGAFLSGGIDSSSIVALMAQVSDKVSTFSITFDEKDYDESRYSSLIARKFNTDHHPILLKPAQLLDELPDALAAMDSPSVDGINTYVISKYTKAAGLTVALSGLGSDELFAGYHYFKMWKQLKSQGFFALPIGMRRALIRLRYRNVDQSRMERLEQLIVSDGSIGQTYPVFRQVSGREKSMSMIRQSDHEFDDSVDRQLQEQKVGRYAHLSQLSIAELTNYTLNVLLKDTDQFSMASALEVREPFFDYKLVDYVVRLPDKWKLRDSPKQLLTDAMGELLPDEIIHRPKRGFLLPWEYWLKNELSGFAREHINYLADRPEFDGDKVKQVWTDFAANASGASWPYVWQLVALSYWIKRNLDHKT